MDRTGRRNGSTGTGRRLSLTLAAIALFGLTCGAALAQAPEADGLRFNRFAGKSPDALAPKAGGPTERIEIQSTDDNRDYVVKAYKLAQANASEVFELIQTAVELEGGVVSRIAPGSICVADAEAGDCRTEYTGESMLVVTVPEWMIPYIDQTVEMLDQPDIAAAAFGTGALWVKVKHRLPSEVAAQIAATAASPFIILEPDDARQLLYIEDTPSYFQADLDALKVYDSPIAQIETRVRIYEVDEDKSKDVGLDWYSWKKSITGGGFVREHLDVDRDPGDDFDITRTICRLSFSPLLATEFLNYTAAKGNAKVITDTRLTQVHLEPAIIQSTTDIPFVIRGYLNGRVADSPLRDSPVAADEVSEAFLNSDGDSEVLTVSSIREFVEGIVVEMTPRISDDVQIEVNAAVTSHVGYTPQQSVPIISESSIDSVILLKPGEAAVLGGLTRTVHVNTRTGIPVLKEVPVLKYLVSREVERKDVSHIIITVELDRVVAGAPMKVPTTEALPVEI